MGLSLIEVDATIMSHYDYIGGPEGIIEQIGIRGSKSLLLSFSSVNNTTDLVKVPLSCKFTIGD